MKSQVLSGALAGVLIMVTSLGSISAWAAGPPTCPSLAQFSAPNLTITSATSVDAPLTIRSGLGEVKVSTPFCRVSGFLTPTDDSHIGFELWLPPAASWNHKLEGVGNGGFSGSVNTRAMVPGLTRGYATMATDYGHVNPPSNPTEDVTWALGHGEKTIDYAYRAEHLTTVVSKQIIDAYYGADPAHSYYSGCSAGGIHGITELLRYPKDYDGYIIGDAPPDHMSQEIGQLWDTIEASALTDPANAIQPGQISLLHKEILKQCAGKDGGVSTDLFLTDPPACKLDLKPLACSAGQDPSSCLNPAQVREVGKIFQGPVDPRTHKQIRAGITPGAEMTWDRWISGKKNPVGTERPWAGFMADIAFSDPDYMTKEKYLTFNFGTDLESIRNRKIDGETLDAIFNEHTRDLDPVKAEGGKVIQYHGWDDSNNPALEAVTFFQSVVADQAQRHHLTSQQAIEATEQFYRLFMVPGMGHCSGGVGATVFGQDGGSSPHADPLSDTLSALELWVEQGTAPDHFVGSHVDANTKTVDMTRPICAYPKVPTYKGTGSVNDANNFICMHKP